jgi:hypothetical protein
MRIDNPCRATLQEIMDYGSLRSRSAVQHLKSCEHCREQLAGYALAWSQGGRVSDQSTVDRFAHQVFKRIEHRAQRRKALRLSLYTLASILAGAVGVYYAGAEIYNAALVPLWKFIVTGATQLPSIGQSLYTAIGRLCTGQAMIAVAAGIAVIWVGMLDRVAGMIRLHRA